MKLGTIRVNGEAHSAFCTGDRFYDIARVHALYRRQHAADGSLEGNWPLHRIIEGGAAVLDQLRRLEEFAAHNAGGSLQGDWETCSYAAEDCAIEPPISDPSKIWCMGANYYNHRKEMAERQNRKVESTITLQGFIKAPSSLTVARAPILYPPESKHTDHEIEVAVIIGTRGRRIPESDAMRFVYGYMLFNDVSARDVKDLDNGRMDRGKGFDTFGVCGPWILTADEVKDPDNIELRLELNGEVRQNGSTKDLLFNIPYQIAWLSAAANAAGTYITRTNSNIVFEKNILFVVRVIIIPFLCR